MKDEREKSIVEDAKLIQSIIAEEQKSWIPGEGVEEFNFLGSQLRDLNWRYTMEEEPWYFHLNREDWFHITVQKGFKWYWNVYVEKIRTDSLWHRKDELVHWNQSVTHTFHWVRSLKHALYIGQYASENFRGFASPEQFFLTKGEYDELFKS